MSTHVPVLLDEVIKYLELKPNYVVVDGTINGGGHAFAIAQYLDDSGILIGIDQDSSGLLISKERLAGVRPEVHLIHRNTRYLDDILKELDIKEIDALLLDLGWSTNQFENSERGFSFLHDGPLNMSLGDIPKEISFTAYDMVNDWEAESLVDVISSYGEERFAKSIVEKIIQERKAKKITSTLELADIIKSAIPKRFQKLGIHPATKTFQALRIAVNDEMGALHEILEKGFQALRPGARMLVISFHSIEDRIVKNFFRKKADASLGQRCTKKPIIASEQELLVNRKARSAKLRVFKKYET